MRLIERENICRSTDNGHHRLIGLPPDADLAENDKSSYTALKRWTQIGNQEINQGVGYFHNSTSTKYTVFGATTNMFYEIISGYSLLNHHHLSTKGFRVSKRCTIK